jgi:hypothetical protein
MISPEGFDWLWSPLEESIQRVLDSWKQEHYRLRRDVTFQIELELERTLLDGHLSVPEATILGKKVDLYIHGPSPEAAICVHINGGPNWLKSPMKFGELETDFHHLASLVEEDQVKVSVILVFDENFYPEKDPGNCPARS